MAKGKIVYIASTNLEPIANAVTSMGQSASKKDKPDVLANKIKAISTDATGVEAEMLVGKTFYAAGQKKTGTMPNRGAANATLNAGGSYVIPQGYHNGSGKVTANSLASQTLATATAAQILSGQTAWVNGNKITGSMSSKGAQVYKPSTVNQVINAGQYLSGAQTILGEPNLVPANIVKGKTIFGVKGSFIQAQSPIYCVANGSSNLGNYRQVSNISFSVPQDNNDSILVEWNGSGSNNCVFVGLSNPIDVSLYKYLNLYTPNKVLNSSQGYIGLITATALSGATVDNLINGTINSSTGWSAVTKQQFFDSSTYQCNIQNLEGYYYIVFGAANPATGRAYTRVQNIYLSI